MKWNGIVNNFGSCQELLENWAGHYVVGAPSVVALEWRLERDFFKRPTLVTTRGMTAIESVISCLTKAGDAIAVSADIYPGSAAYFQELLSAGRLAKVIQFAPDHPEDLRAIFESGNLPDEPPIVLVFTETIGNAPLMRVADITALWKVCNDFNAKLVVDTTFTPLWAEPYSDSDSLIIVGSLTKYFTPNEELMGGYIVAAPSVIKKIRQSRAYQNHAMLPMTARAFPVDKIHFSVDIRMAYDRHCYAAQKLADVAASHPKVAEVNFPGLNNRELIERQFCNYPGGIFYFRLADGEEAARTFADYLATHGWNIAVSFGKNDFRLLPFVGELAKHAKGQGLIRVASGSDSAIREGRIAAFKAGLDQL